MKTYFKLEIVILFRKISPYVRNDSDSKTDVIAKAITSVLKNYFLTIVTLSPFECDLNSILF